MAKFAAKVKEVKRSHLKINFWSTMNFISLSLFCFINGGKMVDSKLYITGWGMSGTCMGDKESLAMFVMMRENGGWVA